MRLPYFDKDADPTASFPSSDTALVEPNGLLAFGGDLSPKWLSEAYLRGYFPWYSEGDPIMWWTPTPRAIIYPSHFHASRSLLKHIRKNRLHVTINKAFERVIQACKLIPRDDQEGTWITDEMVQAYCNLHQVGAAHSLEVWSEENLVGGIYGVATRGVFSGESMFHAQTNASKVAIYFLCQHLDRCGYHTLDCQIMNGHLASLGAVNITRRHFEERLKRKVDIDINSTWQPQDVF